MVDAVVDAVVDWPPSVRNFSRLGRAVRDLDHPVPQLPLSEIVQDLHIILGLQPSEHVLLIYICRLSGSHPAP